MVFLHSFITSSHLQQFQSIMFGTRVMPWGWLNILGRVSCLKSLSPMHGGWRYGEGISQEHDWRSGRCLKSCSAGSVTILDSFVCIYPDNMVFPLVRSLCCVSKRPILANIILNVPVHVLSCCSGSAFGLNF